MKAGIVSAHNIAGYPPGGRNQTEQAARSAGKDRPNSSELAQASSISAETADTESSTDTSKGVIRLLQEGHFKGVADVRLRINFYDELTGMENTQLKAVAGDKIDDVYAAVETAIDSLVETATLTGAQIEAPMEEFSQAVQQAETEFTSSDSPSKEALTSALSSAFEALAASIHEILNQTNEENSPIADEPTTDPEPIEPSEEPTTDVQGNTSEIIENLTAVFTAALDELMSGFDEIQVLPDLSGPTGKGGAYEKFLALYNELGGVETQQTNSEDTEPLDVIG